MTQFRFILLVAFLAGSAIGFGFQNMESKSETQQCSVLTYKGINSTGVETSSFRYYYSGDQIDSIYSWTAGTLTAKTYYTYTNSNSRQCINVNASNGVVLSSMKEQLDNHGNILSSKIYNANGVFLNEAQFTYKCED